jgi:hypothetical protein
MVERFLDAEEVAGSIPAALTKRRPLRVALSFYAMIDLEGRD